jgi:CHAT domain-containing protein
MYLGFFRTKRDYITRCFLELVLILCSVQVFAQPCSEFKIKAQQLLSNEQYESAYIEALGLLACLKQKGIEPSQALFDAHSLAAQSALQQKNYTTADSLYEGAKRFIDNQNNIEPDIDFWLNNGMLKSKLGEVDLAREYYERAISDLNSKGNYTAEDKMKTYHMVGAFYYEQEIYSEAIGYTESAFEQAIRADSTSETMGIIASELSKMYREQGSYKTAVNYALISLENTAHHYGKESRKYCNRLKDICQIYTEFGMYDKASESIEEALEIAERVNKNGPTHVAVLNQKASLLRRQEKFVEGLEVRKEVLRLVEDLYGKDSKSYMIVLNNIGLDYMELDSLDQAIEVGGEAIGLAVELIGSDHTYTNSFRNNVGMAYEQKGNYVKALDLYTQAAESIKSTFGENHTLYAPRLMSVARCNAKLGNAILAFDQYKIAFALTQKDIQAQFYTQTQLERSKFLTKVQDRFNELQAFFTDDGANIAEASGLSYNVELATKGMLLNSSSLLKSTLQNSTNPSVQAEYEEWLNAKRNLVKQYELPESERRSDFKEFESSVEKMENQLLELTENSREKKRNESWKQVQRSLGESEYAVEFLYVKDPYSDDVGAYYALVLSNDAQWPQMVELCTEDDLKSVLDNWDSDNLALVSKIYGRGAKVANEKSALPQIDNSALYSMLWNPLEAFLPVNSVIYFSTTGHLQKISFAAMKSPEGAYLFTKYTLHQVSTTANLESVKDRNSLQEASLLLVGGLDYGEVQNPGEDWLDLDNTSLEVNFIKDEAEAFDIRATVQEGKDVSEEVFRREAPNYNIIHLATHGFYFDEPESSLDVSNYAVKEKLRSNPDPLFRSGMIFAGANEYWSSTQPFEGDDQVLTAAETSLLELNNVDLLVLSACETGLGDIKGKEGVYGLYRGFKMAGVQTMIYSLWTIADKETYEFMKLFYESLLSGDPVEKAFSEAQLTMSQTHKPYYWAGFVLID